MQNFIIMNSAGRFYSRAGMPYLWAVSERDANVYGCHDEAVIHARFIEQIALNLDYQTAIKWKEI